MDLEKRRILHLISQRPDSTGSGMYVQAMIREAAACGYVNYLVAGVSSNYNDETEFIEHDKVMYVRFYNADVNYHIPGMSDIMPYESSRFCDLNYEELNEYEKAFTSTVKKAVDTFKPDIIHSHHLWIVSSLACRLFPKIPVVTTCHGSDLRQFQKCNHLTDRVLKGCRKINTVMALSEAQKNEIIRLYKIPTERVIVTGAGYNNRLFFLSTKPEPDPVKLLYAGKLSNAKGVLWLLRALKLINSPEWQLHLVGDGSGDEKENCLTLAREFGEKIIIHGALPQMELAKIMRESHIFILPSFFEGLPLVILESLASGCRIVATNLPGIVELLGGLNTDFINLVETPRLRNTDQPYSEDEKQFEHNLNRALRQQIDAAKRCQKIDLSQTRFLIDSFTWFGIFKKVNDIYLSGLNISSFQKLR